MLTNESVIYNGVSIVYDDLGFWTVQYCGDDVTFDDLSDAYRFIDKEMR